MRHSLICALILAGALGGTTAQETRSSFEQAEAGKEPTRTSVTGKVVSMSGLNLAIETPAGNRMDLELGSDSVLPVGIATGDQVLVSYRPADTGVSHVIEVARTAPEPDSARAAAPGVAAEPALARQGGTPAREVTRMEPAPHAPPQAKSAPRWLVLGGVLAVGALVAVALVLRGRS